MFKTLFLSSFFTVAGFLCLCHSAEPREEIASDRSLACANFRAYPGAPADVAPVNAPEGYTPFYISTYARHGSRFHMWDGEYARAAAPLMKADSAGVLTAKGEQVLGALKRIWKMSENRLGELTPLGARQHRGIARRMYENFPEVFSDTAHITARSTDVVRCIMSMMAECLELQSCNPSLKIDHDGSKADIIYMNNWPLASEMEKKYAADIKKVYASRKAALNGTRMLRELISDTLWIQRNIPDTHEKMWDIFFVAANMQSHNDPSLEILDIFTDEELYDLWKVNNGEWYMKAGNSPVTGGDMPFTQVNLLKDILDDGASAVKQHRHGAKLRFGHESVVLPVAVRMELDGAGYSTSDIDNLEKQWADYRYFPMACNIQLVFYGKPGGDDVLVRVLLNEHDATLPVKPVADGCFYKWTDLEKYYRDKISKYEN